MVNLGKMENDDLQFMLSSFPQMFYDEIIQIAEHLKYNKLNYYSTTDKINLSSDTIKLPYRIYYVPFSEEQNEGFSEIQKRLVLCYFLAHQNGYIRQKSLRELLATGKLLEHEIPYIMALLGSYVIEIIDDIFENFELLLEAGLSEFICLNPQFTMTIEGRLSSYWGEYYQHISKRDYSGFKIQRILKKTRKSCIDNKIQTDTLCNVAKKVCHHEYFLIIDQA